VEQVIRETREKMQKAWEAISSDFATIRSGKANTQLVENIVIPAYAGTQKLRVLELATIHIQDPQTIILTPFDQTILAELQKGIEEKLVGASVAISGNTLRITLPPLSEERRAGLVKLAREKGEAGRIMIRQARRDAMEEVKKLADTSLSEDEVKRLEKEIQKLTDEFVERIDSMLARKEEELMQI